MPFGNPIIGGGDTLVRNAIQSEGFTSGSTGWRIERTGDAEFNGITARGSVVLDGTSTLLVYDSSGNIIAAISPAGGTDPESGQTYSKGIDSYDVEAGSRTYQINLRDGVIIFNFLQSNVFLQRGLLQANEPLSVGVSPSLGMYAPSDNADQLQAAVVCYGTSQNGTATHRVRITGIDPLDDNAPIPTLLDVNGDLQVSGIGQDLTAVADADVPIGTTTLTDVTGLALDVAAGAVYRGLLVLFYVAGTGVDLDYAWDVPAGSAGRRGVLAPDDDTPSDVSAATFQDRVSGAYSTEFRAGGAGGSHKVAVEHFVLAAGATGQIQLQAAQGTADAADITVLQYSHLQLTRIA